MFLLLLAFPQLDLRPGWDLYIGGDLMLNGISSATSPFRELKIPQHAVFVANLEIPLTDTGARTPRKSAADIAARNQYVLKASPGQAKHLAAANFDVLVLGNNHTMDGGVAGWKQSKRMLEGAGILICGAGDKVEEADAPAITSAPDGTKIAVLSMLSFRNPGSNWICTPATDKAPGISALSFAGYKREDRLAEMQRRINAARLEADMVIVMPHWGIEKQPLPSDVQVEMGRQWIDAGADLVMGLHPHVLQPGELYKEKPIVYSLGNFINPGAGRAAIYKFRCNKARVTSLEILETRYSGHKVRVVPTRASDFLGAEKALQRRFATKESKPLLGTLSQR